MHHFMKMTTTTLLIATILFSLSSCKNFSKTESIVQDKSIEENTSNKTKKDTIAPRQFFELLEIKEKKDTIVFITCVEYVYSPFGIIKNKQEIKHSLLNNFVVTDRKQKQTNGEFEFQILKKDNSKLILFFDNDPEATKQSYVFKGEIYDNSVKLDYGIRIGMSIEDFFDIFLESIPEEFNKKYKVIVFESCVIGEKQVYSFENSKLVSVIFETDSYWKVDYE